jgi:PKD repeat protein
MITGTVAARTALATLLLFSFVLICSAGAPALPCEFYGTVTIDGSPAPVGTILSAKINDAERGQYVLEEAGKYGGPGTFDQRLKVVAEENDLGTGSAQITFWINGQKAWQETAFQPGVSMNLDLSIGGDAPAVTNVPVDTPVIIAETKTGEESVETAILEPEVEVPKEEQLISDKPIVSDMPPQLPEMENPLPISSGEAMVADFIGDPVSGTVPLTVTFTDLSTGSPTMWAWDFGDGTTDMIANPVHQYMMPGTYTVRLTVSNQESSSTQIKEGYISVTDTSILHADFTASPTSGKPPLLYSSQISQQEVRLCGPGLLVTEPEIWLQIQDIRMQLLENTRLI